jgi:hypothetical protein
MQKKERGGGEITNASLIMYRKRKIDATLQFSF